MDYNNKLSLTEKLKLLFSRFKEKYKAAKKLYVVVNLLLLVGVSMIISLGWYVMDRQQNYQVNRPSPKTYLALSSARYEDHRATSALRQKLAGQIVEVRVRDEDISKHVNQKIDALRDEADLKPGVTLTFLSIPLRTVLQEIAQEERVRILRASFSIASLLVDKTSNREEQASLIWQKIQKVDFDQAKKNIIFQIVDTTLTPTLNKDIELADRLKDEVSRQIPPVVREIKSGGFIVQKGQIVTPETAKLLLSQGYPDAAYPWKQLFFALVSCFFWSFGLVLAEIGLGKKNVLSTQETIYITLLLLLYWAVQRLSPILGIDSLAILAITGWFYMTLPPIVAFHVILGGGILGYLIAFGRMPSYVAMGCILSMASAGIGYFTCRDAENRFAIWRSLFFLGACLTLVNMFLRWGLGLNVTWLLLMKSILLCMLWSSVVIAFLPLWETLFGILSPLRLIELSHPSQPLLKRLQLEAPGTYHHIIMVGTLAEAAADRLQMNGLLVKAGAYYHDIGKLKRPSFFVENQQSGENIHDQMSPSLSSLVILSHVRDGIEIAEKYKLPRALYPFIEEHHGNTTLSYFYRKALEKGEEVSEDAFRYPGPRPQSRETALVMLADSVEAAIKSVKKNYLDTKELTQLVEEVISVKIMGGQLDDVDFTMADLAQIKSSFVETLRSMQHSREVKAVPSIEQLKSRSIALEKRRK